MTKFAIFENRTPRFHDGFFRMYGRLTDEMYSEILELINPCPFETNEMTLLLAELDPKQSRPKGQPKGKMAPRKKLAAKIQGMAIPELSASIKDALCDRLANGIRYTSADYNKAAGKIAERDRFRMFLRGLKNEFEKFFPDKDSIPSAVSHEQLGQIEIPARQPNESPAAHRMRVVGDILHQKLGYPLKSVGTLQNVAAFNREKIVMVAEEKSA